MARRTLARTAALGLGVGLGGGLVLLVGCPAPDAKTPDRICTPGSYVYCRCESRVEGTKLCNSEGNAFGKCNCGGGPGGGPPPGYLDTDGGHERIDAALPPDSGPSIDARCGGKLAVVASTEEIDPNDKDRPLCVFGAAYQPDGTWIVAKSKGGPLRGRPSGGLVGSTLVVVWRSGFELIGWTKFDKDQKDVLPFLSLGSAYTTTSPVFVASPASGRIYSQGIDWDAGDGIADNTLHEGIYTPATGWDDATEPVVPAGPAPPMSAPAAALIGTSYVLAYAGFGGGGGQVFVQQQTSGAWGTPTPLADASPQMNTSPLLTALAGGNDDLMLVYLGSDLALHWSTRKASDATWSNVGLVDPSAVPSDPDPDATLAPMTKGRAMLVWKAVNGAPFYSVYDPTQVQRWSAPAGFYGQNPQIVKSPQVSQGNCASEATSAFLGKDGNTYVGLFNGRGWDGPYLVPALTKMSWVGAGEVP